MKFTYAEVNMEKYTKFIEMFGYTYVREFAKIKHHANKKREVREATVAKFFKGGKAEVLVVLVEEDGKEILITPDSSVEDVKKYLGKSFIK